MVYTGLTILTMYCTMLPQYGQSFLGFFKNDMHQEDTLVIPSQQFLMLLIIWDDLWGHFQYRIGVTRVFDGTCTGVLQGCKVHEELVI
jgi:hypothetical protein